VAIEWIQKKRTVSDSVNAPVQYGARITAFVIYLLHYQLLPENRLVTLDHHRVSSPRDNGDIREYMRHEADLQATGTS
jgi:hypothetical protein